MVPRILIPAAAIAALFCLASPAVARAKEGSIRVRVVRLEGAAERLGDRQVSVRVSIGAKRLYDTPPAPASKAAWNKGLRAYTAANRPLVFRVMEPGAEVADDKAVAKGGRPRPRVKLEGDEAISDGLDDLVADYGSGTLDEGSEPRKKDPAHRGEHARDLKAARAKRASVGDGTTICKALLEWPPEDGEHTLDCGGMKLVVTTKAM